MANPFDQFDGGVAVAPNPFDQFDSPTPAALTGEAAKAAGAELASGKTVVQPAKYREQTQEEMADVTARVAEPYVPIPQTRVMEKMFNLDIAEGAAPEAAKPYVRALRKAANVPENVAEDFLGFMESPLGIGTLGLGAVSAPARRAMAYLFAGQAIKQAPDVYQDFVEADTPEKKVEAGRKALETVLMATGAVHEGARVPEGGALPAERAGGLTPDQANVAATQNQLRALAPETAAEVIPKPQGSPDVLDGMTMARRKLTEGFADAPPEQQKVRQTILDHIDDVLLAHDNTAVNESEARTAPGQSTPQESPPATAGVQASPPTQGGRSSLFTQAAREGPTGERSWADDMREAADKFGAEKLSVEDASLPHEEPAGIGSPVESNITIPADSLILGRPELSKARLEAASKTLSREGVRTEGVTPIDVSPSKEQPGKYVVNGDGNHRAAALLLAGEKGEIPVRVTQERLGDVDSKLPDWMSENAKEAVSVLSEPFKKQISDLAYEGKTAKEIASQTGIDEDTIRSARIGLGIPSQTIGGIGGVHQVNPDFQVWRENYGKSSITPAIELPNGQITTGENHVAAYDEAKKTTPDTSGAKEGFVDEQGNFLSREEAAQKTGLPTKTEPGKLHSSDLPETKGGEPTNEKEKADEEKRRSQDVTSKPAAVQSGEQVSPDAARLTKVVNSEIAGLHGAADPTEALEHMEGVEDDVVRHEIARQYGIDPEGKDANDLNMEIAEKAMETRDAAPPLSGEKVAPEFEPEPKDDRFEDLPGGGRKAKNYLGGPGAMGPVEGEELASQQATTGLKKATVLVERLARGEEPLPPAERQSEVAAVEKAVAMQDSNPQAAGDLVARILDKGDTAISRDEAALLLVERNRVNEDMRQADAVLKNDTASDLERAEAQANLKDLETQIDRLDRAQKEAGSQWGRVGRMYQRMIREDYTLEGIQRKMRTAKGGPLNEAERAQTTKLADAMQKDTETRDAAEATRTAQQEKDDLKSIYEKTIADLKSELTKTPKISKPVLDIAQKIVDRWKADADVARKSLRERLGRTSAGVDPTIVLDVAKIMRAHVGEIGLDLAKVSARVLDDFGDAVKPYLKDAWKKARDLIDKEAGPAAARDAAKKGIPAKEKTPADIAAKAKAEAVAGEELSNQTVYELARAHIKAGVHGEDAVMAAVHKDIQEAYPGATERDVRRAFSDYGKTKFPSQEAVAKELRELRTLTRLQESIDRLKEGQDALKTGPQRDKATQEIRAKQKQLDELLKTRQGPPSPEKLASQEDARITALQNRIADIDKELRTGERPPESTKLPDSPAVEQLKAERDAMQEKLDEVRDRQKPKANPEAIAAQQAVDRAAAALDRQQRINSGEIKPEPKEKVQPLSDLEKELRDRTEELKRAQRTKTPDQVAAEQAQKGVDAAAAALDRWDRILKGEEKPEAKTAGEPRSNLEEELRSQVESMKRAHRELEAVANRADPDVARAEALRKSIAELDDQLKTGSKSDAKTVRPDSPEVEQLRAERDAMRQQLREIERAAKPKADPEVVRQKAQLEALGKSIADYERRVNEMDFSPKPTRHGPDTKEVAQAKVARDAVKKVYDNLEKAQVTKPTPEETYNKRRLKQVTKRIADLEDRLKTGNFEKEKPVPLKKTAEVAAAEAKLTEVRREVDRAIEKKKYDQLSPQQKFFKEALSTIRSITAIKILGHGSVGMITHAGGLIFRPTRAAIYWKNFGRQFGMWHDKAYHEQLVYRLKNDPEFETWKKAGASIDPEKTYTDYGMYAAWLGKLGEKGARGFDALKLVRMEMNKADWARVPEEIKADPKQADAARKLIADINNKATGATPKTNPTGKTIEEGFYGLAKNPVADALFFAPRLYASRWGRVLFDPVKTARTLFDPKSSPAERFAANTRLKNAAEFTGTLAAVLLTNQAILSATGSKQNVNLTDPTKSDWLKFKAGGKTLTADGGLLDPVRLIGQVVWKDLLASRTAQQQYREGSRYKKAVDTVGSYLRGKLNPAVGLGADIATGSDFQGRPLPFSREKPQYKDQTPYTWGEWLLDQGPIPLEGVAKEVAQDLKDKGFDGRQTQVILKAIATFGLGMAGIHVGEDYSGQPKSSGGATVKVKRR